MISGGRRAPGLGTRVALLLGLPALVLLGGQVSSRLALRQDASGRAALDRRGLELAAAFRALLDEAGRVARTAIETSPAEAARGARGPLAARLEGVGVLDAAGRFSAWEGTPAEPRPVDLAGAEPAWSIRKQGFWIRLLAVSPVDADGRSGAASFLLESPLIDSPFLDLIPEDLARGASLRVEFEAAGARSLERRERPPPAADAEWSVFDEGPPATLRIALSTPDRKTLAWATIAEIPAVHRADRRRSVSAAIAASLFSLLLATLFPWKSASRSGWGLAAVLGGIGAARASLLLARVPARLLPRDLGAPTLFGSSESFGLLGSPADLLLTSLAVLAAAIAIRSFAESAASARLPRVAIAGIAGLGAGAALVGICLALARNARVSILAELSGIARSPGRLALYLGLLVAVLAAADLAATFLEALQRARGATAKPTHWALVAVMLVPFVAGATAILSRVSDDLALERIRSEYAPQILEQSSRRRVALVAAVREASQSARARDAVAPPATEEESFAAYRVWVAGDLFHAGFSSSIDFYDASGMPRSHFGFDLPRLAEAPPRGGDVEPGVVVREEEFPVGAERRRIVHAEAPIVDHDRPVGRVVGHVVEEPDDLPFLPKIAPYLAALGPGAPRGLEETLRGPGYVLFDASGSVLASTLGRPPAASAELKEAAKRGATAEVRAGDETYVAVPIESAQLLHVLLVPRRGWLERTSTFFRLYLLALVPLAALALVDAALGPRRLESLLDAVRGSLYRKILASLLLASVVPAFALALFLRGYFERRGEAGLVETASGVVKTAARVVEDYAAVAGDDPGEPYAINDEILSWLRRVVDQEILLYEDGTLQATSRPELFSSGLLSPRLPGEVQARVVEGGLPYLVLRRSLGPTEIPVAYARVPLPRVAREAVVAVPLVLQQREADLALARVGEMLVLVSVLFAALVAAAGALLARTVTEPVRELVEATGRIATGDYGARIEARTRDEVAELVRSFHGMGAALAEQRADLERRRDYMEALLRHASAGVVSTDAAGAIVTLNPAAATLLASPAGAPAPGEPLVAAVARNPDLAPVAAVLERRPRRDGEPEDVDLHVGGKPRRLRLVRASLPDPTGGLPGTLTLVDDVTELMRSNQLAAWAEMARAIAHEIKNPLTPIQLSAEHLRRLLADRGVLPSAEVEACIETVVKQVRALREIASEFSAYAKLPTLVLEPGDPVELVREVAAPYRAAHPRGIAIEERYEPAPAVPMDRRVLSRAVVNLVENAIDAMPGGGVLSLSVAPEPATRSVVLSVSDTGHGLDPSIRDRLFEPYFSTKSSGTGLGLAIARRAVEAHGGSIVAGGRPGGGTVFSIRLPVPGS
jgi:signal transduction histidine kinase/HAMP domain-containing protein